MVEEKMHSQQQGDDYRQGHREQGVEKGGAQRLQVIGVGKQVYVVLYPNKLGHCPCGGGGEKAGDKGLYKGVNREQQKDEQGGKKVNHPHWQLSLGF